MTKREAATNIICSYNWCSNGCPLFDRDSIKCLAKKFTESELIRIARKDYLRKSQRKDGEEYMQHIAREWTLVGGARVV